MVDLAGVPRAAREPESAGPAVSIENRDSDLVPIRVEAFGVAAGIGVTASAARVVADACASAPGSLSAGWTAVGRLAEHHGLGRAVAPPSCRPWSSNVILERATTP